MIPAQLIDRLVRSIVDGVVADDLPNEANRRALNAFIDLHGLDLEDAATLWRIAAGEGSA